MSVRRNREWLKKAARQLRALKNPTSPISEEIAQWLAAGFEAHLAGKKLEHALGLVKEAGRPKNWRDYARVAQLRSEGMGWPEISKTVGLSVKTISDYWDEWLKDEFAQRQFEQRLNAKLDKEIADANMHSLRTRGKLK